LPDPAGDGPKSTLEDDSRTFDQDVQIELRSAAARDAAADARDRAADARDLAAAAEDGELEKDRRGPGGRAWARKARDRAAADRDRAAADRRDAARYRREAQEERATLLRQIAASETDALTGARARAPGLKDLKVEIDRAQRSAGDLAVAYVDVVGGNALLEAAVRVMRTHLRSYDVVVRIGDDEFVCVMAGATIQDSRHRFGEIQLDAAACGIAIRYGIAGLRPGDTPSDLIERADSDLLAPIAVGITNPVDTWLRSERRLPVRILVSDDRPETMAVVNQALAERYSCEFAAGLEETGEMLADDTFDLLLCDLRADAAVSFARQAIEEDLDTAVILLAEEDDPVQADKAFEFGAFGYVVRPLPGQLLITVMNALRRRDLEMSHRRLGKSREDRRQAIIDMVPIGIYAKDNVGRYLVANAKAEELARTDRGGLVGKTDGDLMSAEWADTSRQGDVRILEGEGVIESEDTIEDGDGSARTFKTIRFPLFDGNGTIIAVGGVSADVTAEREAIRLRDRSIEELGRSRQETVERLARAIDRHDASTGQHVNRLSALTSFLATKLGLDPDRVELLGYAAPMHDVGKIGTPVEILCKPGPLTGEERSVMEGHTIDGYEILSDSSSELLRLAATIALTHHERYDGGGYPNHLAGEEIPLEGRITAVADVFDALLSDRAYRPALPVSEAVELLREGRGTQFDPGILDLLLDHLDEALVLRGAD
jgi:PAS domain S-box-containing protein